MRHMRGVYARNVNQHDLADTFFRILVNDGDSLVCLYESEPYERSLNPTWTFDEWEFLTGHAKSGTRAIDIGRDSGGDGDDNDSGGGGGDGNSNDGHVKGVSSNDMIRYSRIKELVIELVDWKRKDVVICRTKFNFMDAVYIGSSVRGFQMDLVTC